MSEVKRILIGFDGSENSLRAIAFGGDMAKCLGAKVTIFHAIVPSETTLFSGKSTYASKDKELYSDRLAPARSILDEAGVDYDTDIQFGNPAEEILEKLEEGYDMVIIGHRGLSGIKRFLMGSVSSNVAAHSNVPAVVVP